MRLDSVCAVFDLLQEWNTKFIKFCFKLQMHVMFG